MSVSRKVLRKMKKVMGLIGAIPVLAACSSQVSCAKVCADFNSYTKVLSFSGKGIIKERYWRKRWESMRYEPVNEVVIEYGITEIDDGAFHKLKMKKITIPDSVTKIGSSAFWYCGLLDKITIPNGVTEISSSTFRGCSSLKEVNLPNAVTSIGSNAFDGCCALGEITIPDSVTSIGNFAFEWCKTLKKINIPNGVTKIGHGTFMGCTSLEEVIIPNGVTEIGDAAFEYCKSLKKIVIPNSVTKIGYEAFKGCTSLEEVIISNSVTEIGFDAFLDCERLKSIVFDKCLCEGKTVTIGNDAFGNCKMLGLIDTNGLLLNLAKKALNGTIFQNLSGKVICGKYHAPYHQDMMAKMLLLDRSNKNGKEENPVNCLSRYPLFIHS